MLVYLFIVCLVSTVGQCVDVSTLTISDGKTSYTHGSSVTLQVTASNVTSGTVLQWLWNNGVISNTSCVVDNITASCGSWKNHRADVSASTTVNTATSISTNLSITNFTIPGNFSFQALNDNDNTSSTSQVVQLSLMVVVTTPSSTIAPTHVQTDPPTNTNGKSSTAKVANTADGTSTACVGYPQYNTTTNFNESAITTTDNLYTSTVIPNFKNCTWTNITLPKYATSTYTVNSMVHACGNGCPYQASTRRALCNATNGACANEDGSAATACATGYTGFPKCQTPVCSQGCNGGTCVGPNWCSLCPFHYESGPTCRNVKLDGFTKGSLSSISVLIIIIILLKAGSFWYKKNKVKEN